MNARRQQPINYVVLNAIAAAVVLVTYLLVSATSAPPSTILEVGAAPAGAAAAASTAPQIQAAVVPAPGRAAATAAACAAGEQSVTSSDTFSSLLSSGNVTGTVSLTSFDASLGELKSVHVATAIGMNGSGRYTLDATSPQPELLSVVAFVTGKLTSPDGQTDVSVAPGTTIPDTRGPVAPGDFIDFSFVGDFVDASSTPSVFAPYTSGSVDFEFNGSGIITYSGGANKTITDVSKVTASASVTYCYAPPATSAINIVKTVEAGAGASVPTFAFTVTCSNGFAGDTTTPGAGSVKLDIGVAPTGTTCTVTEVFASSAEASRWAAEVNGACGQIASGVAPDGTVTFNNRLWSSYDKCSPAT